MQPGPRKLKPVKAAKFGPKAVAARFLFHDRGGDAQIVGGRDGRVFGKTDRREHARTAQARSGTVKLGRVKPLTFREARDFQDASLAHAVLSGDGQPSKAQDGAGGDLDIG